MASGLFVQEGVHSLYIYDQDPKYIDYGINGKGKVILFKPQCPFNGYINASLSKQRIPFLVGCIALGKYATGFYRELLSLFVSREDPAASWNALFSEKSWRELEVAIHALKNNAMSLGMEALAGQAKEAEDHTRTQTLSKQDLNALLSSVTAMRQAVQTWLS